MEASDEIINKIASSSLVTFDLEQYHQPAERVLIDIKDQLFQNLILKEKDFRAYLKEHNWSIYKDKIVALHCSADAIIPTWAYMLLSIALQPYARGVYFGTIIEVEVQIFHEALLRVEWEDYKGAKVVIKGCSKIYVPVSAYVEVANKLRPFASSIMYGEPCSTVPLYKKERL